MKKKIEFIEEFGDYPLLPFQEEIVRMLDSTRTNYISFSRNPGKSSIYKILKQRRKEAEWRK